MYRFQDNPMESNFLGPLPTKKWAYQKVPHADESLSSWILRVLRHNFVNPMQANLVQCRTSQTHNCDNTSEEPPSSGDTGEARFYNRDTYFPTYTDAFDRRLLNLVAIGHENMDRNPWRSRLGRSGGRSCIYYTFWDTRPTQS